MDCADHVGVIGVTDDFVQVVEALEIPIARLLVGAEQADLVRDAFLNEAGQHVRDNAADDAGHNLALALDCANHGSLAGSSAAGAAVALAAVLVVRLAADESLAVFNDAYELVELLISKARADAVAGIPSGLVGARPEGAVNLEGAYALLWWSPPQ